METGYGAVSMVARLPYRPASPQVRRGEEVALFQGYCLREAGRRNRESDDEHEGYNEREYYCFSLKPSFFVPSLGRKLPYLS
jgi:hypothetical protein